jgi:hypothetical protein
MSSKVPISWIIVIMFAGSGSGSELSFDFRLRFELMTWWETRCAGRSLVLCEIFEAERHPPAQG